MFIKDYREVATSIPIIFMKLSTSKTRMSPSTQLRKIVFGGSRGAPAMLQTLGVILTLCLGVPVACAGGMEINVNAPLAKFPPGLIDKASQQPYEKGFIDVTKPPYGAVGDGVTDDSDAIQKVVDDAYRLNLVAFFPAGKTFLLSRQLKCITTKKGSRKFAYELVGSTEGPTPILKLKDGAAVEKNIFILFQLLLNGRDASASLYGSTIRGIHIDMGRNPGVSALSMSGAQYCTIEDVLIDGAVFEAGVCSLPGSGGGVVNLTVRGGKVGVRQDQYRPNPTLVGVTLESQSLYAVQVENTRGPVILNGFKVVAPVKPDDSYRAFALNPSGKESREKGSASLCLVDGTIEIPGKHGVAIANRGRDLSLNNVFVKAATVVDNGGSEKVSGGTNHWVRVPLYAFTSPESGSSISVGGVSNPVFPLPIQVAAPGSESIPVHGWSNMPSWEDEQLVDVVKDFGATPENINAKDDDGPAIQKAIDTVTTPGNAHYGKTVFLPRGHYHIGQPLNLRSGLKLVGAGRFISVIQPLTEWKNAVGPVVQSEDVPEGSLTLSDFAVLGYSHTMLLHLQTPNIVMRDVATELNLESRNSNSTTNMLNPAEVPYLLFSGHAGGKIYNVCTDHLPGREGNLSQHVRPSRYNLLQVKENIVPITFYQLSIEHQSVLPQVLFDHARDVTVVGFKYEPPGELLDIVGGEHFRIFGGSGNYDLQNPNARAIIVVENARDLLFQSMNRKGALMAHSAAKGGKKYWLVNGDCKLSGDVPILLYRDGYAPMKN